MTLNDKNRQNKIAAPQTSATFDSDSDFLCEFLISVLEKQ